MAIPLWVSRSKIFDEFSFEKQKEFFDLKQKKVIADYDNFYYSMFLDEDKSCKGIEKLLRELEICRDAFDFKKADGVDFCGFDYFPFGLKFYNNRLSIPECYDVLICNSLPNEKTPRIVVQLRARYLWLYGFKKCFNDSLKDVQKLLKSFDIVAVRVKENRLDYAFHTNCIQSFDKFFDRERLIKTCKTKSRIYCHVGDPQHDWSIDYFSVGSRSSKSVFFRAYNKTREVVEKAYKAFFIEKWHDNGLISNYDKYCLEQAYLLKSYDVGLLVGRIKWYKEFGTDIELKKRLDKLLKMCYANNDNSTKIRKEIAGVLPEVTVICNMEFETHTDFYRSFEKSFPMFPTKIKPDDLRYRCMVIYECRKSFVDYLTSTTLCFVRDKNIKRKDFKESDYLHFWRRVRSTKLGTRYKPDVSRSYERNLDVDRAKRKLVSDAAVLSLYKNGINEYDLTEDISDMLSLLNDNDMCNYRIIDVSTGEYGEVSYGDHYTVKKRKGRQYRSFLPSADQSEEI